MTSRDPARWIALYLYAAVLARQANEAGEVHCGYCGDVLTDLNRTIDHVDGNQQHNTGENLLAACHDCNQAAGRHNARGTELLEIHLRGLDIRPADARRRVQRILSTDLPDRNDPLTKLVAEEFFSRRLEYQRELAAHRRGHEYKKKATAVDLDEQIPF